MVTICADTLQLECVPTEGTHGDCAERHPRDPDADDADVDAAAAATIAAMSRSPGGPRPAVWQLRTLGGLFSVCQLVFAFSQCALLPRFGHN